MRKDLSGVMLRVRIEREVQLMFAGNKAWVRRTEASFSSPLLPLVLATLWDPSAGGAAVGGGEARIGGL